MNKLIITFFIITFSCISIAASEDELIARARGDT